MLFLVHNFSLHIKLYNARNDLCLGTIRQRLNYFCSVACSHWPCCGLIPCWCQSHASNQLTVNKWAWAGYSFVLIAGILLALHDFLHGLALMKSLCACRLLYDKRFSVFHYPVLDEDAPDYRSIIHNPMDVATLLQHVDCGQYLTLAAFLRDIDLIVANAKVSTFRMYFFSFINLIFYST